MSCVGKREGGEVKEILGVGMKKSGGSSKDERCTQGNVSE